MCLNSFYCKNAYLWNVEALNWPVVICDIVVVHTTHSKWTHIYYINIPHPLHPPYTYIVQPPQPSFTSPFSCGREHMPTETQLRHISITEEQPATTGQSATENVNTPHHNCSSILGVGFPPVPANLVSKIGSWALIEMANLLPKQLSTYYSDQEPKARMKTATTTNSMKWL